MGSQSVTWHPTHNCAPPNPGQTGRYLTNLPQDEWKAELTYSWMITYTEMVYLLVDSHPSK